MRIVYLVYCEQNQSLIILTLFFWFWPMVLALLFIIPLLIWLFWPMLFELLFIIPFCLVLTNIISVSIHNSIVFLVVLINLISVTIHNTVVYLGCSDKLSVNSFATVYLVVLTNGICVIYSPLLTKCWESPGGKSNPGSPTNSSTCAMKGGLWRKRNITALMQQTATDWRTARPGTWRKPRKTG